MGHSKACSKCKQVTPIEGFSKNVASVDGLKSACKACLNANARAYAAVHKLEKAITNKAYRATSKAKSYARAYSFRNKEGLNAYGRAYYVENKERVLVYGSAWQKANPEACAKNRQKRRVNKEGNKTFLITAKELACIRESLCTHCGAPGPNQVDHVIPVSKGGTDGVGNLMPLCKRCNQSKGASFYSVFKVRQAKALLVSKTQSKDFLPA